MEESPDVEFDHFLAEKLSMTVATLRRTMPAAEWLSWSVYYGRKAQRRELEMAKAGG